MVGMVTTLRRPSSIVVRQVGFDDVVELAALKRRVERVAYAHLGTAEALSVRLHRRGTAWWLMGRIAAGDAVLLATRGDQLLGLGAARLDEHSIHLHSTYVEAQRQGVGSALTAARLDIATAWGLRVLTADCFVGATGAQTRLAALGLRDTGRRSASHTFPGVGLSHWVGSVHTARERLAIRNASPRWHPEEDT